MPDNAKQNQGFRRRTLKESLAIDFKMSGSGLAGEGNT